MEEAAAKPMMLKDSPRAMLAFEELKGSRRRLVRRGCSCLYVNGGALYR